MVRALKKHHLTITNTNTTNTTNHYTNNHHPKCPSQPTTNPSPVSVTPTTLLHHQLTDHPDIDEEPSPSSLSAARALIAAELTTPSSPPTHPSPNFTPTIQTELARIASSTPLEPLNLSRYETQELPPSNDPSDLRKPLQASYVSSSYLSSRLDNLALLDKSGKNAWLLANYHLEAELRSIEAELAQTKREIDLVNNERATRQNEVKGELLGLEETWKKGVGRVLETEIAVEELRQQIRDELKKQSAGAQA